VKRFSFSKVRHTIKCEVTGCQLNKLPTLIIPKSRLYNSTIKSWFCKE
jgi:hypothetical protein